METIIKKTVKKVLKNSNIQLGILKGKIRVAKDTFEEDNRKTLVF